MRRLMKGVFLLLVLQLVDLVLGDEEDDEHPACCSADAWGQLKADADYVDLGRVDNVNGLDLYTTGENSSRCVIWNYDIFGFDSGRTRQLADRLASQDFRNGDIRQFVKDQTEWTSLKRDWDEIIKPFAEQQGCLTYGAFGTCWGTYPVIKLSALPEFKAGVSAHPSHPNIMRLLSESERDAYEAVKGAPQLFMPSSSDSASVKLGGLAAQVLGNQTKIVEFDTMSHGWTVRGDLSKEDVRRDVKKAMELTEEHFRRHLKK